MSTNNHGDPAELQASETCPRSPLRPDVGPRLANLESQLPGAPCNPAAMHLL